MSLDSAKRSPPCRGEGWARGLVVLLLATLAACGSLPLPLAGHPGLAGARLSQPPPARLAVLPPTAAMLSDIAADTFAGEVTDALVGQEVPAIADQPHPGDWSLVLTAELQDGKVVPSYEVRDPHGKPMGLAQGQPVDPRAWSDADPKTMQEAAAAAAPSIATLLQRIDAAQRQSDPNSLLNRPPRVLVKGVTGAPGDGNSSLAMQMRRELPKLGEVVDDTASDADFSVAGEVKVAQGAGNTQRIEIQWIVNDATGEDRGRIVQLNEVPLGTLDRYWGDVAQAVAHEAAGGVQDVILNQTGARKPGAAQGAATATAAPSQTAQPKPAQPTPAQPTPAQPLTARPSTAQPIAVPAGTKP